MSLRSFLAALAGFAILSGCAARQPAPVAPGAVSPALVRPAETPPIVPDVPDSAVSVLEFSALEGWSHGDHLPVLESFREACGRLGDGAATEPLGGSGAVFGTVGDWSPICTDARKVRDSGARKFFERWFVPVSIGGAGAGSALFTAYFEPELRGARRQGGPYQFPLYAKPPDLQSGVPYLDRAAIDGGALSGRGLELFWVDDPIDSFFLHIQGSGRVRLPDGSVARVGYAGKNNRAYKAIGRTLVDWDEMTLDEVSAQSIKDWITANPDRRDALLASNPSYVFFQERPELAADPSLGPVGSFGQPLPAQRAIAVDRAHYPLGAPVWVDFESPVGPVRRLTLALDTGGAIKGPRRADYFFGSGEAPGAAAGATRARGKLIALAPRAAIERLQRAGS